jgi:hypothetical protein
MDWRCGSSNRVPALQVQSPEFKAQFHQKKKRKKELDLDILEVCEHFIYSRFIFSLLNKRKQA